MSLFRIDPRSYLRFIALLYIIQVQSINDFKVLMGATIFGGMLLQYPMGKISNVLDLRKVIVIVVA